MKGELLVRLVKKVKKEVPVKKEIRVTKVKKVIKETKDFLEHWEIKDSEVTKVFEENRVKEAKKAIWVIADLLEIRVQLESPEVRVSLVRLDYQVIRVIRVKEVNKEREDYRANKVSAEIVVNKVKKDLLVKRVFRVIKVQEEIREKEEIRE